MSDEQDTSINSVQTPIEPTLVVPREPVQPQTEPVPDVTAEPEPVVPVPVTPVPTPAPVSPVPVTVSPKSFLGRALEKIQFRKKEKLAKIVAFAQSKKSIPNAQVEKLLHVSDSTAGRYLHELVTQGKLRKTGTASSTRYEPTP